MHCTDAVDFDDSGTARFFAGDELAVLRAAAEAADKAAHNGYQKWHRDVDDEVIDWLERYSKATPEEFEAMLRGIYNRPDMRARFPDGL